MIENEPPFGVYQPTAFEGRLIALGRRLEPTKFGKRTASFLRSALKRLRTDPLDLEVIGQKMRLYAANNACEKRLIVTPQFFDPVELAFLKSRIHPSFVFLDIGCNVGAYSVYVAKNAGPQARVLAVDPNAIVLDRLEFNAAANGLTNIQVARAAVADVAGDMEFALEESNMGGSSLQLDRQSRGGKTILKVPVRTLADLVQEAGFTHVDAIKIDVEGFEDKVLIPYLRSVPRSLFPKAVIFEANVGSWQNDLIDGLAEAGYKPAADLGGNGIYLLPAG
ncbi:MAG: FkbM family methyltransferase [Hyphomicrobium sp.]|nr:FkbM family methyltransferase [Hyphomicrobium sp.]